ncbi:MAG: hypothetical protein GY749_32430 [Desulfobacteraceae bacterium]|nr:hypothetical protein [Desulfobacteraceae bacterium]
MDKLLFKQFAEWIRNRYKLVFADHNAIHLHQAVKKRCQAIGIGNASLYLTRIRHDKNEEAIFINEITVSETSFFRYSQVCEYLKTRFFTIRQTQGPLKILHIGSSTGEEPYTTAILLDQAGAFLKHPVIIMAVDIDKLAVEHAKAGEYRPNALRNIDQNTLNRYFKQKTRDTFELVSEIRNRVSFHCQDIFNLPGSQFMGTWDLIFCMNVMIYFDQSLIDRLIGIFKQLMHPGSQLFSGPADSIVQLNEHFQIHKEAGFFWYSLGEKPREFTVPQPAPVQQRPIAPQPVQAVPDHAKDKEIPAPCIGSDYYLLGRQAYDNKQIEQAITWFKAGIEESQHISKCNSGLARIYADQGRHIQAAETAELAIISDPDNDQAYLILAILNLQSGNKKLANTYLNKCLQLNPACGEAKRLLVICDLSRNPEC